MLLHKRPRTVITGSGSGLGRAFALELASLHAKVLIADINEEGASETARLVADAGGEAHVIRCDVSKSDEVEALVGEADRALGGVDLLINNAGVVLAGPVGDVPLSDWEWMMNINLWGVIYGCHAFVPRFKQQKSGHILNVASASGFISSPRLTPYNVSKAAVIALSESLCAELLEYGIGVTVLCPTLFETRIGESLRAFNVGDVSHFGDLRRRAKIQADGVAQLALKAVDAGQLYAMPHPDGRLAWWLKRASPHFFQKTLVPYASRIFV